MSSRIWKLGVSLVVLMVAAEEAPVLAQTAGGSSTATAPIDDANVGEVVVTAQRRSERIQDVPASVTAVTGEALRRLNIVDSGQLELLTPGLNWGNAGGARSFPTLRGVETTNGEGNGEPAIAFFVDGVYKSRVSQAQQPLVDTARVEVLRGPQGTLFGRNSTGGAINVISNDPVTDGAHMGFDLTGGNYDTARADAFVNLPLSGTTAVRVAASNQYHRGYLRNVGGGPDQNDQNLDFVRGVIKHQSGAFTAIGRASYLHIDRNGVGGFAAKSLGQTYRLTGGTVGRSIFGTPYYISPRVADGIADIVVNGVPRDIGVPVPTDPYVTQTNFPARDYERSADFSAELSYDLGPATLRSITGYTDFLSDPIQDNDLFNLNSVLNTSVRITGKSKSFQEELQLASSGTSRFTWVVGGFYLRDRIGEIYQVNDLNRNNYPKPGGGTTSFQFDRRTKTATDSYAGYAQGSLRLSDAFSLTLGGRYTRDDKDYQLREFGYLGTLGSNPPLDITRRFEKFTWKAGAEFRPSSDHLLYASYSTGFRSGGFNRFNDDPTTANDERVFDSETIGAYEIGSKNSFFDRRVTLNISAFIQKITNQQVQSVVTILNTGQAGFFNAGRTNIKGIEIEFRAQPVAGWIIQGTGSVLDAKYGDFVTPAFAADPAFVNLRGNEVPRTPRFRGNLFTSYDVQLGKAVLTPAATLQYSTRYYQTQFNTAIDRQPHYAKLDLRLAFRPSVTSPLRVEAFVENVTDKAVQAYGTFGGSNAYFVNYLPPRTYGARLSARF